MKQKLSLVFLPALMLALLALSRGANADSSSLSVSPGSGNHPFGITLTDVVSYPLEDVYLTHKLYWNVDGGGFLLLHEEDRLDLAPPTATAYDLVTLNYQGTYGFYAVDSGWGLIIPWSTTSNTVTVISH